MTMAGLPEPECLIASSCRSVEGAEAVPASWPRVNQLRQGLAVAICTYQRPAALARLLDSLAAQTHRPDQVIVVDASPDEVSEAVVRARMAAGPVGGEVLYCRVAGALRGLTRQRNLALRAAETDLIAFFDDDIVLLPETLGRMEQTHRAMGESVVGVGACIENQRTSPGLLWRLRRLLYIVPALAPGRYYRSGISTPWSFLPPTDAVLEGDWLPGGATMWRTQVARETGFNEGFAGYGSGEDLEFSLRIGKRGRLLLNGGARVLHLHESGGRPDHYRLGFSAVQNQNAIHRHCVRGRRRRDAVWFVYAQVADLLLRSGGLLRPATAGANARFLHGRIRSLLDLAWRKTSFP